MSLPIICATAGGIVLDGLKNVAHQMRCGVDAKVFRVTNVRATVARHKGHKGHEGQNGRSVKSCIGATASTGWSGGLVIQHNIGRKLREAGEVGELNLAAGRLFSTIGT